MGQFHVHENTSKASRQAYPYLLDIQCNLLDGLRTTVVVPLCPERLAARAAIARLTPVLELDGKRFIALFPQLTGIDRKHLGRVVGDLSAAREHIVAALDVLISGV